MTYGVVILKWVFMFSVLYIFVCVWVWCVCGFVPGQTFYRSSPSFHFQHSLCSCSKRLSLLFVFVCLFFLRLLLHHLFFLLLSSPFWCTSSCLLFRRSAQWITSTMRNAKTWWSWTSVFRYIAFSVKKSICLVPYEWWWCCLPVLIFACFCLRLHP